MPASSFCSPIFLVVVMMSVFFCQMTFEWCLNWTLSTWTILAILNYQHWKLQKMGWFISKRKNKIFILESKHCFYYRKSSKHPRTFWGCWRLCTCRAQKRFVWTHFLWLVIVIVVRDRRQMNVFTVSQWSTFHFEMWPVVIIWFVFCFYESWKAILPSKNEKLSWN